MENLRKECFQFLKLGIMVAIFYFVSSWYGVQSAIVVGRSMTPTLSDSQVCLINRWSRLFHLPKPFDIVVIRDPSDNGLSVKRIIGTPGDSILIENGRVYVNKCKLNETYVQFGMKTFIEEKYQHELIVCGKKQYFVLGDNRTNSVDSRSYGLVPRKNILGTIIQ